MAKLCPAGHTRHCSLCCQLTDLPVPPEEVDVGLFSEEALLLQKWEDVHERLLKDGHCRSKLVRRTQEPWEKDKRPARMCQNSLNWTRNLRLRDRTAQERTEWWRRRSPQTTLGISQGGCKVLPRTRI